MNDPIYYCGEPDADFPLDRRTCTEHALAKMAQCDHPESWREPSRGLVGDGACQLCGASALTLACHRRDQRQEPIA